MVTRGALFDAQTEITSDNKNFLLSNNANTITWTDMNFIDFENTLIVYRNDGNRLAGLPATMDIILQDSSWINSINDSH